MTFPKTQIPHIRLYSCSLDQDGRHQEEDAGHEAREGQCHGQVNF